MPSTSLQARLTSTIDEYVETFERKRSVYVAFTNKLKTLLEELLQSQEIKYHTIESRTKEVTSFRDKISGSNRSYQDPLNDIKDLSGLRVIVYYLDDVDSVCELIKREFFVDEKFSVNKGELLGPNEFGYRSVHYIISLPRNRRDLLEWRSFAELTAEIQVRTVLQHAWASISHTLDYKRESEAPSALRRKLLRLAGLLELSDEEFLDLRVKEQELSGRIVADLEKGKTDVEINTVSLVSYLSESPLAAFIEKAARNAGFEFDIDDEEYSDLISVCLDVQILTIKQLDTELAASRSWVAKYLEAQLEENSGSWEVDVPFLIELILMVRFVNKMSPDYLVKRGWGKSIAERVLKVAKTFEPHSQT